MGLRIAVIFLILTVYLEVFITRTIGAPVRTLFDVIVLTLAMFLIARVLIRGKIKLCHLSFFISVTLFSIISSLGALEPEFFRSVASSIIFSKFIIVFFLARHVNFDDLRLGMKALGATHILGVLLSFLFPQFFHGLLPQTSYELDVSRLMGFSLNANRAAAISSVLLLYYSMCEKKALPSALFLVLLLFSESRSITLITAIVFSFLVLISRIYILKKIAIATVGTIFFVVVLLYFISLEDTLFKIENTLFGDLRYIRAAMLMGGFSLAGDFFPFGVGGGLYGSSMSHGSEAYALVGISHWNTVIDMTGVFDSGFGSILGEYGYAGLLVYTGVLAMTFRYALAKPIPTSHVIFLVLLVLFMSFFRTVASDFFYSFYFLFLYLLISEVKRKQERG